jgi:hypothetical protein
MRVRDYDNQLTDLVGAGTNPSSGNKIVMVMLTNGSKVTKS